MSADPKLCVECRHCVEEENSGSLLCNAPQAQDYPNLVTGSLPDCFEMRFATCGQAGLWWESYTAKERKEREQKAEVLPFVPE